MNAHRFVALGVALCTIAFGAAQAQMCVACGQCVDPPPLMCPNGQMISVQSSCVPGGQTITVSAPGHGSYTCGCCDLSCQTMEYAVSKFCGGSNPITFPGGGSAGAIPPDPAILLPMNDALARGQSPLPRFSASAAQDNLADFDKGQTRFGALVPTKPDDRGKYGTWVKLSECFWDRKQRMIRRDLACRAAKGMRRMADTAWKQGRQDQANAELANAIATMESVNVVGREAAQQGQELAIHLESVSQFGLSYADPKPAVCKDLEHDLLPCFGGTCAVGAPGQLLAKALTRCLAALEQKSPKAADFGAPTYPKIVRADLRSAFDYASMAAGCFAPERMDVPCP